MSNEIDELSVPDWLSFSFFKEVLSKDKNDESIEILNATFTAASGKDEHYASVMYRAKVEYSSKVSQRETISLIIKTLPHEDCTKKDLLELFIFETEIGMYSDTVPKFEKLLRKAGEDIILGARSIFTSLSPHKVIIMEDLVESGYDLIRHRRCTLEETKAATSKLAKWHAASYVLNAEEDSSVSQYSKSLFNLTNLVNSTFLSDGVHQFTKTLLQIEDLRMYHEKFLALKDSLVQECADMTQIYLKGEKGFFVLNHGDYHIKNVMVKRQENGDIDDLKMVDFQLCFFGPATYDVLYMLYGIADSDTRINHRDEVIYFYFETFLHSLLKMGFEGELPKLADLKMDFLKYRHYEVYLFVTFMPLILAGENMGSDLDTTSAVENADYRRNFYSNKTFVDEARILLPMFLHLGYLD